MDNYPEHLTPAKDARGIVLYDQFEDWWAWSKYHLPHVPEDVARYLIHENWGASPYSYLSSRNYQYELVEWTSERLFDLRSEHGDFDPTLQKNVKDGEFKCHNAEFGEIGRLARYITDEKDFPHPFLF